MACLDPQDLLAQLDLPGLLASLVWLAEREIEEAVDLRVALVCRGQGVTLGPLDPQENQASRVTPERTGLPVTKEDVVSLELSEPLDSQGLEDLVDWREARDWLVSKEKSVHRDSKVSLESQGLLEQLALLENVVTRVRLVPREKGDSVAALDLLVTPDPEESVACRASKVTLDLTAPLDPQAPPVSGVCQGRTEERDHLVTRGCPEHPVFKVSGVCRDNPVLTANLDPWVLLDHQARTADLANKDLKASRDFLACRAPLEHAGWLARLVRTVLLDRWDRWVLLENLVTTVILETPEPQVPLEITESEEVQDLAVSRASRVCLALAVRLERQERAESKVLWDPQAPKEKLDLRVNAAPLVSEVTWAHVGSPVHEVKEAWPERRVHLVRAEPRVRSETKDHRD